jgi:GTP-binding protein HflX
MQSFKSTLDEVREADLLIHVIDVSHPNFEEQLEVVNQTLKDIDPVEKPVILVFNKMDAFTYTAKEEDDLAPEKRENISLEELKKTWMAKMNDNCIFISAKEKLNIERLKEMMYDKVKEIHVERYPHNDFLYQNYSDMEE